jgi:hypothetical protein
MRRAVWTAAQARTTVQVEEEAPGQPLPAQQVALGPQRLAARGDAVPRVVRTQRRLGPLQTGCGQGLVLLEEGQKVAGRGRDCLLQKPILERGGELLRQHRVGRGIGSLRAVARGRRTPKVPSGEREERPLAALGTRRRRGPAAVQPGAEDWPRARPRRRREQHRRRRRARRRPGRGHLNTWGGGRAAQVSKQLRRGKTQWASGPVEVSAVQQSGPRWCSPPFKTEALRELRL